MPETTTPKPSIRKTIYGWFDELGSDGIASATKEQFLAKVLSVNPDWDKKDDAKKIAGHFAWYKGAWRKANGITTTSGPAVAIPMPTIAADGSMTFVDNTPTATTFTGNHAQA